MAGAKMENHFEVFCGKIDIDIDDNFRIQSIDKCVLELFDGAEYKIQKGKSIHNAIKNRDEFIELLQAAHEGMVFSGPLTFNLSKTIELNLIFQGVCKYDLETLHRIISLNLYSKSTFHDDIALKQLNEQESFDLNFVSSLFRLFYEKQDFNIQMQQIFKTISKKFGIDYMIISIFSNENLELKHCEIHSYNPKNNFYKKDIGNVIGKPYNIHSDLQGFDDQKRLIIDGKNLLEKNDFYLKSRDSYHINSMASFLSPITNSNNNFYIINLFKKDIANWTNYEINTFHAISKVINVILDFHDKDTTYDSKIRELLAKDNTTDTYVFDSFLKIAKEQTLKNKHKLFAYIAFDVNHFSFINSHCSDEESVDLLKGIVARFRKLYEDILVARLYGDNFMIMMSIKSKDELHKKLTRLTHSFSSQMNEIYPGIDISLSLGVYISKIGETDTKLCAENASYSHRTHKNGLKSVISYYDEEDDLERKAKLEIESSFKSSLRSGQYKVFLQPKFDLCNKKVIGAEALSRLQSAKGSLISPANFIPILEQSDYILQLDMFVYEEVVRTIKKWLDLGYEVFPVSINFSRQQILMSGFVNSLIAIANRYGVPHHYLDIEITETTLANNFEYIKECVEELRDNGFKISMDDFGVGYSSLNMLANINVTTVKIDKAFVDDIASSVQRRGFFLQIANLIKSSEKEIVVEGVETNEQADVLLKNHINNIQGFLISKPLPINEFEDLFLTAKTQHS